MTQAPKDRNQRANSQNRKATRQHTHPYYKPASGQELQTNQQLKGAAFFANRQQFQAFSTLTQRRHVTTTQNVCANPIYHTWGGGVVLCRKSTNIYPLDMQIKISAIHSIKDCGSSLQRDSPAMRPKSRGPGPWPCELGQVESSCDLRLLYNGQKGRFFKLTALQLPMVRRLKGTSEKLLSRRILILKGRTAQSGLF